MSFNLKPILALLGIGLIILGLFGIAHVAWLGWLDILAGLIALVGAGVRPPTAAASTSVGDGIGVLVLFIIALASGLSGWLPWWTFAFGVALVLAPVAVRTLMPPGTGPRQVSR